VADPSGDAPPAVRKKRFFGWVCLNFLNFRELSPIIYAYEIPPPLPLFGAGSAPDVSRGASSYFTFKIVSLVKRATH